jgi:hypothetical protein
MIGEGSQALKCSLSPAVFADLVRAESQLASNQFQEHHLDLVDSEGREFVGRLATAKVIAEDHETIVVYMTQDDRVIVHYEQEATLRELSNVPEKELRSILPPDVYIEAMEALGIPAVIDI